MRKLLFFVPFLLAQFDTQAPRQLVWQDEFEGNQIDDEKWTAVIGDGCPDLCGFGNEELQYYDSTGWVVSDGRLSIVARNVATGDRKYTSARLITKGKGDWQYGRVEIRAKLPFGRGTWPAIWMLPTLAGRGMKWPLDGEIDIMEHVGYNQGMIYGTIHTDKYNHGKGTHKNDSLLVPNAHEAFHVYAVTWDHQSMVWEVDGEEYFRLAKGTEPYEGWPFDQKFHLILNVAVGGTWGGKYGIDDTIWPQAMEVDYVRVYQ
ncbi:MAG: glycoside hydrolase family 16 protein [Bacteroidota bacterium]